MNIKEIKVASDRKQPIHVGSRMRFVPPLKGMLYCCYAAVILYSPPKLGEAQYHLQSKYNRRSQYNSPQGEYN